MSDPFHIELVESPRTERFLADDGQMCDVTGHSSQERRTSALVYFEDNTKRPKPPKKGDIWIRIAGSAHL